jgi:hypothetical protein
MITQENTDQSIPFMVSLSMVLSRGALASAGFACHKAAMPQGHGNVVTPIVF